MTTLIKQLVTVLENEVQQHSLLIAAAHSMNTAAKNRTLLDIKAAAASYEACISNIADLEEQRLAISDELCRDTLQNLPHASLLLVAQTVPVPYKATIIALREKLQCAIQHLSKVNSENRVILTESLLTMQKTFELIISQSGTRHDGYKRLGKKDSMHNPNPIINSVV